MGFLGLGIDRNVVISDVRQCDMLVVQMQFMHIAIFQQLVGFRLEGRQLLSLIYTSLQLNLSVLLLALALCSCNVEDCLLQICQRRPLEGEFAFQLSSNL